MWKQLGEGPSRGILRDFEPSDRPSLQALVTTGHCSGAGLEDASHLQPEQETSRDLLLLG